MKIFTGIALIVVALFIAGLSIFAQVHADFVWNRDFGSTWSLGVKASTIEQKSQYVDQFVSALEAANLSGIHDTLWFPTADNSFDSNLMALQSLQSRLKTVQGMDENSFQYQTAIQQITAQEQDEATDTLNVVEGAWYKKNHFILWMGGCTYAVMLAAILVIVGSIVLISAAD